MAATVLISFEARQLVREDLLKEVPIQNGFGCTVRTTATTSKWLTSGDKLKLVPNAELLQYQRAEAGKPEIKVIIKIPDKAIARNNDWISMSTNPTTGNSQPANGESREDPRTLEQQTALYAALVKLRADIAGQEENWAPYMVASNKNLVDMAKCRPTSIESLLKIDDYPENKINRFGKHFCDNIKTFCAANRLPMDKFPEIKLEVDTGKATPNSSKELEFSAKMSDTVRTSYIMFQQQKKTLDYIAYSRGIKAGTVQNHLAAAIEAGADVDLERAGVSTRAYDLVTETVSKYLKDTDSQGIVALTPIKEMLPDWVEWGVLKLCLAMITHKYGEKIEPSATEASSTDLHKHPSQSQPPNSTLGQPMEHELSSSQGVKGKRKLPNWWIGGSSQSSQRGSTKAKSAKKFKL